MTNLPGLNFQLGEDIDALRDAVRDFAQAEIAPRAAEADHTDQFPMDLWHKMGDLGVLGITVPDQTMIDILQRLEFTVDVPVPYTHPRAHETRGKLVCRLLL